MVQQLSGQTFPENTALGKPGDDSSLKVSLGNDHPAPKGKLGLNTKDKKAKLLLDGPGRRRTSVSRGEAASNRPLFLSGQSDLALQRRARHRKVGRLSVSGAVVTCRIPLQLATRSECRVSLCLLLLLLCSCNALPEPRNQSILPEQSQEAVH